MTRHETEIAWHERLLTQIKGFATRRPDNTTSPAI